MVSIVNERLIREYEGERMLIEAFGKNSLRVRVTRLKDFPEENWALIPQPEQNARITLLQNEKEAETQKFNAEERIVGDGAVMENGRIRVTINKAGKLIFENSDGKTLLRELEFGRHTSLGLHTRGLKTISGGNFKAVMMFESDPGEKLFGMGQYQNGIFNLKGSVLELAQRNSQASVPFVVSSLGYGFFWNNPAVGRASFGTNVTQWEAESTKAIDFWITAGDTPAEIHAQYMAVTGRPPMMPEYGMGFWQCKLRYQTQEELLTVAREYHRRGVPLDVIIADFFHWTLEGTWAFDPEYWPDPEGMVQELEAMGTKLMVSVWPTVSVYAPDYEKMKEYGYLIQTENGVKVQMLMIDPTAFVDVTNPGARSFVWDKIRKNYYDKGVKTFWLDVAEPEFSSYDYENYRYHMGSALEVGNQYPVWYTKMIHDGLTEAGEADVVSLVRCAWAGSQRYGALVWSGDIASTFESFRIQIVCGLQMAMAGIPWWTTDIGGFYDGDIRDPKFHELLIRWFQYGTFCPVMRLHGTRIPSKPPLSTTGGGRCASGAENEIWSYGEDNYEIMKKYIGIREQLRPYTRELMNRCHETGCPIIRPLFYNFPEDETAWEIKDQFLYGDQLLIAPVTEYGARKRMVYLPKGADWVEANSNTHMEGGQWIEAEAPLERIPVFIRRDAR